MRTLRPSTEDSSEPTVTAAFRQAELALGQDKLDHGPLSVTLGSVYSYRSPPFKYVP